MNWDSLKLEDKDKRDKLYKERKKNANLASFIELETCPFLNPKDKLHFFFALSSPAFIMPSCCALFPASILTDNFMPDEFVTVFGVEIHCVYMKCQ